MFITLHSEVVEAKSASMGENLIFGNGPSSSLTEVRKDKFKGSRDISNRGEYNHTTYFFHVLSVCVSFLFFQINIKPICLGRCVLGHQM